MPKRSRQSRRGKRATRSRRKCGGKGTRKYRYRGGKIIDVNSMFNAPGNYIMDKIDRALAGGRRRTRRRRRVKRKSHRRRR